MAGATPRQGRRPHIRQDPTAVAKTVDLSKLPTRQVLALWAQTLRELRDRKVVRTFNNPIGDIAEALVALHYKGRRGSFSQASWDVKTPEVSYFRSRPSVGLGSRPAETSRRFAPITTML